MFLSPIPTQQDLGWENAGGETAQKIDCQRIFCKSLGHKPIENNRGMSGTIHDVTCDECAYVYHYDSGD